jgi:hypothetical protein
MSLVKFLPAWLHAIADYAVALSLIAVALIVGGTDKAVATGVVIGAVVLVVSLLTKYPLGVVKVLPFTVHSAGDYLAVVLLAAAPFALSFHHSDGGLTVFYLVVAAAVLLVSLITNYQYSPKRQVAGARAADTDRVSVNQSYRAPATARTPSYAPVGSDSWRDEPIYVEPTYAEPSYRAPAPAATRPGAGSGARSLREILAEQRAQGAA